jgi:hypothetical protein
MRQRHEAISAQVRDLVNSFHSSSPLNETGAGADDENPISQGGTEGSQDMETADTQTAALTPQEGDGVQIGAQPDDSTHAGPSRTENGESVQIGAQPDDSTHVGTAQTEKNDGVQIGAQPGDTTNDRTSQTEKNDGVRPAGARQFQFQHFGTSCPRFSRS